MNAHTETPKNDLPGSIVWRPAAVELWIWCAIAWAAALVFLAYTHSPGFGNDGYQYLSVADNIRYGRGASTSIVYFDAERARGVIPAPLTTFPPGYPLLVALGAYLSSNLEVSALRISQLSFAFLPLVLGWMAPIGVRPWTFRLTMALLVFNVPLLGLADSLNSDLLFTVVVAASLLCFSRALSSDRNSVVWQIAGWLLVGGCYWIRYTGLFVFAGLFAFFALYALLRPGRRTLLLFVTSGCALFGIGAAMFRTSRIAGSWRGGVARPAASWKHLSLRPLATALYHLVFGEAKAGLNIATLLLMVGLAGLLAVWWFSRRSLRPGFRPAWWMLCSVVSVYCAAMVYADLTMVISFGARYFAPLLPVIFFIAACWLSRLEWEAPRPNAWAFCLLFLLAGYLGLQARALSNFVPNAPHLEVLNSLHRPGPDGDLLAWVARQIPASAVVAATDGQATAYVLQHPVLCVSDPPFTEIQWTHETLLSQMRRFQSSYLVVYRGLRPGSADAQDASPVIRQIISSGAVPTGFELAARNSAAIILRRLPEER